MVDCGRGDGVKGRTSEDTGIDFPNFGPTSREEVTHLAVIRHAALMPEIGIAKLSIGTSEFVDR